MENKKLEKLIGSVDKLLKFFTEKKDEKFEAVKAKDSDSMVEYSSLEVGADVSLSTGSGSETAPDGKYSLSNDVEFTVKGGKIESIENTGEAVTDKPKPSEELADVQVDDSPKEVTETPTDEAKEDEVVKALADRVSAIEETLKSLMDNINAVPSKNDVAELSKELKSAYSAIQTLSKIPTQFSADSRVEVKESEMEKYNKLAAKYSK